ncbi:MAG: glycosyltransferase family 39 protein [Candidatus Saccharimonadales bacterium]
MVQSSKSFVLDEMDFPTVSNQTSQTGVPIYYHSEQEPNHSGTYHPTLYINLLAGFIRIFGFNETVVRAFGLICVLLSAYLLILIMRLLINKASRFEPLLLGLFLLNPYTISNATLPDIDPTILPLVILLFIYASIRYVLNNQLFKNKTIIVLGLLFALALWAKLTTPLILPVFLLYLSWISSNSIRTSLLFTIKVFVLGITTFVFTYLIYCLALKLSISYTYTFLWASFTKGTSSEGPLMGVLHNLTNFNSFVYWITIPLFIVLGVATISLFANKAINEKDKIKKLLIATALLTTIFYIGLMSPFGGYFKYPFPLFGLLLLSIIFMYDKYLLKLKVNIWYVIISFLAGFIIEKTLWGDSMFLDHSPVSAKYMILFVLIALTLYWLVIRSETKKVASMFLILLISFSMGFQLSISRIQATAPYPTKYLYGQLGIDDAAAYIRANTNPDEVIWSMKDVGQYSQRRHQESYAYYFDKSLQDDLIHMLKEGKIRYYITTTGIGEDSISYYKNIGEILNKYAQKEKQFNNFVIYKATGATK